MSFHVIPTPLSILRIISLILSFPLFILITLLSYLSCTEYSVDVHQGLNESIPNLTRNMLLASIVFVHSRFKKLNLVLEYPQHIISYQLVSKLECLSFEFTRFNYPWLRMPWFLNHFCIRIKVLLCTTYAQNNTTMAALTQINHYIQFKSPKAWVSQWDPHCWLSKNMITGKWEWKDSWKENIKMPKSFLQ